jgi:hypothetical protein
MGTRKLATGLAVIALLALPASAAAGGRVLEHIRDSFDFTVDDFDACGITVTAHFKGSANIIVRSDAPNLDRLQLGQHADFTYTNEANGHVMTAHLDLNSSDLLVTDNGDGTITDTYAVNGRTSFTDTAGKVYLSTSGRIVYADTINLNGTPDDGSDDFLQSFEILQIAGQHPGAEGGNFCNAANALLS